ncbi:MAG: hypothetical protein MMC33_002960 [Icmadophila ericetorum]|nr:hypothetical protein [Icmadophila ericetorum]
MEGPQEDGDTSIKPVSSLRMHFESMTTAKTSPAKQVVGKLSAQASGGNVFPSGRPSSFDIPRSSSYTGDISSVSRERVRDVAPSPDRKSVSPQALLHPENPLSGIPKLSGSVQTSQPKSLDRVQKKINMPQFAITKPSPASAPVSPGANGSRYIQPIAVVESSLQGRSSQITSTSAEAPHPNILYRTSKPGPSDKINPAPPLPINRATKPKMHLTSQTPVRRTQTSINKPQSLPSTNRPSPFSTPSSSDGSSEMEGADVKQTRLNSRSSVVSARTHDYFQIHSTSKPGTGIKISKEAPVLPARRTVPNAVDLPVSFSLGKGQELPPGLPPRPSLDRAAHISMGSSEQGPHRPQISNTARPGNGILSAERSTPYKRIQAPARSVHSLKQELSASGQEASSAMRSVKVDRVAVLTDKHIDSIQNLEDSSGRVQAGVTLSSEYPDFSQGNRRPPHASVGVQEIETRYDTRLFDLSARYVCTTGYLTKVWDIESGELMLSLSHGEREIKVTSMAFKPSLNPEGEGLRLWLGTNYGEIQELDIPRQSIIETRPNAHARREIIKIYRYWNEMWSLDEDGKLQIWLPDSHGLPNLQNPPISCRVPRGHTFSIVVKGLLWLATGKEIRIFDPSANGGTSFQILQQPLIQPSTGEVTSGTVISNQMDRIYFGHTDGKVTIYLAADYTCVGIVNVSVYKINSLAGAGFYLWAGYNTGMVYVYDTRTQPWKVKKDWQAHVSPVTGIITNKSSTGMLGALTVASIGNDNAIRMWDGTLEMDWLEDEMQEHDAEFCNFREIKCVVMTWNAGATTPQSLRSDSHDSGCFREILQVDNPAEIIVFGFQELVDLDDKKLTAKSLFKSNKKKDSSEQEHMSHQYREWRDYLSRVIEHNMPSHSSYHLLHTSSMVGLFTCIFIKSEERSHIRNLQAAEVKRGIGGLHGNKGALVTRFILDDTSICFTNCHLAAGQTQTMHRNNDIAAILEATALPPEQDVHGRSGTFIGGGDGSMITDHEICVLNGDLNYRIDTMGRDTVVKAVQNNNFSKLLERDQLLVSRRRNPGFRLRAFNESPITFAPTYKYDVGTDKYDTSEKNRSPAWCDRLLYRGAGRIQQLTYRRHEVRISDHRPVSGTFKMRIKSLREKQRLSMQQQSDAKFRKIKQMLLNDAQYVNPF